MHIIFTYNFLKGSKGYKSGFNGQIKDDEIYGEGNAYSAEFWEYDARIGRRWNLDPVDQISISNYACFGNNPIFYIDEGGDFKREFWAKAYARINGGEVIQSKIGSRAGEYYVRNDVKRSDRFYESQSILRVLTKNDEFFHIPTVTKEIQITYGFGENIRKDIAKKGAYLLRNTQRFGKLPNPMYKAEAYTIDIGASLGAEADIGMSFVLSGDDAGKVNFFTEIAGGVANEGNASIEVGRVDYSGNPNDFKEEYLYGSRKKGWIGIGEFFTGSFGVAKSDADGENTVTTSSISVGVGGSIGGVSGGYNVGNIEKLND